MPIPPRDIESAGQVTRLLAERAESRFSLSCRRVSELVYEWTARLDGVTGTGISPDTAIYPLINERMQQTK